jgi:phosphoenolpyruvate carboxykinase (GTP)
MISNKVCKFVNKWSKICKPSAIRFCDGSKTEFNNISSNLVNSGFMKPIPTRPNSFYVNSDPSDVARTEKSTFICTKYQSQVGPSNNWRETKEMHQFLENKMINSMRGRTMYVIPYIMGIPGFEKKCIQLSDSPYVTLSQNIMSHIDSTILEQDDFIKCIHSVNSPTDSISLKEFDKWYCSNDKYIAHFPEQNEVISIASNYGGNALLGKKSISLRLASYDFHQQGDKLAEHMLILGITNPQGVKKYILAAFPSSCGKTNLAMLKPTGMYADWKIETVGDDIAWIRIKNGKMWASNPENGFFGIANGTNAQTNPNAMDIFSQDTIFTNVGYNETKGDIYWKGLYDTDKSDIIYDWRGNKVTDLNTAAHPNSRFTSPLRNCKTLDPNNEVPIAAIIFGGRRSDTMPLISEATHWEEGVHSGFTLASEQTAAADGKVGELRYDPFAMLPFCGYNINNHYEHWLSFKHKCIELPKIFNVNWFRKDNEGKYIWPGFRENMRVLEHIFNRVTDPKDSQVIMSQAGLLPISLNLTGLSCKLEDLNKINKDEWKTKMWNDAEFGRSMQTKY